MNASRTYADEAYHRFAPKAQSRAHQNTEEYMRRATNYLNRNEFNQLKLPSVDDLGSLANHLSIAERTARRIREKAKEGGRRKTRRKRKKTHRKRKKTRRKRKKRKTKKYFKK